MKQIIIGGSKFADKTDKYLKLLKNKKVMTIAIIIMIVAFFANFQIGVFFALIYFGAIRAFEFHKKHKAFMQNFAKQNNLKYLPELDVKTMSGRLFEVGHSKRASYGIHGEYNKYPIRIFNYHYTVGSGKNSKTCIFTVCEINFENLDFPHIFLKSDSMLRHGIRDSLGQDKDIKISLEEQFDKKFDLYCTQDYEIEALQIFTPKLLDYLVEHGNHFSIEFSKDKVYIYDDKIIRNEKEINQLYTVVKKILDNSGELIKRLDDDFEAMHNSYRN
jgi:hypothetical protein